MYDFNIARHCLMNNENYYHLIRHLLKMIFINVNRHQHHFAGYQFLPFIL